MKKLFSFLIITFISNFSNADIKIVDFDQSMGKENKVLFKAMFATEEGAKLYNYYKKLWEHNSPDKMKAAKNPIIPKKFHQLWVGPKPIPKEFLQRAKACQKLHPDWEYKLWREKDLKEFDKKYPYLTSFHTEKNYAGRKDLYSLLILNEYGGIFSDIDIECLRNLDELAHKYNFFGTTDIPRAKIKRPVFPIAFMGSKPDNIIINETLKIVEKKFKSCFSRKDHKYFYTAKFKIYNFFFKLFNKPPVVKCGSSNEFSVFSTYEALMKICKNYKCKSVVFPATYLFPIYYDQYKHYSWWDKLKIYLGLEKRVHYFSKIRPETFAYHRW
ncbi:MAG: glycosyltransferase [Rickettsiales bacterium]